LGNYILGLEYSENKATRLDFIFFWIGCATGVAIVLMIDIGFGAQMRIIQFKLNLQNKRLVN
jgi:hypothetical protein